MSELACEACGVVPPVGARGRSGIHLHHWSYAPEHKADTIPLCIKCHRRVHAGSIPEPRTGREYRASERRVKPRTGNERDIYTMSLPPDVVSMVDQLAAEAERPRSWMVRTLLREALAARKLAPKQAPE